MNNFDFSSPKKRKNLDRDSGINDDSNDSDCFSTPFKKKSPSRTLFANGDSSDKDHRFSSPKRLIFENDVEIIRDRVVTIHSSPERGGSVTSWREGKELSLEEELELASEFGGITEGIENLNVENERGCITFECDEGQKRAIALANEGKNMFLTGKAGTGKSWTIQQIVASCESQNKKIELTAPTGIAAVNIGGKTVHSWGSFNLGEYYSDFDRMMSKTTRKMIRSTDILLIDEVSMVSGHFFDVLECMVAIIRYYDEVKDKLKNIKETSEDDFGSMINDTVLNMRWKTSGDGLGDVPAWGGLQLIVVGDFFQLPPVPNNSDWNQKWDYGDDKIELKIGRQGCYAFESHSWHESNLQTVELEEVHRQDGKDGLLEFLSDMREGKINRFEEKCRTALWKLQRPLPKRSDGIVPTELHARNRDVDKVNSDKLEALPEKLHVFESVDKVVFDSEYKLKLLKKHKLFNFSSMPYLFASVEEPPTPPALQQARLELEKLEKKKKQLITKEAYEALITMRQEFDKLKEKVVALQKEEEKKSEISVSSIAKYLEKRYQNSTGSSSQPDHDPEKLFRNYQGFKKQLQRDYRVLEEHAQAKFFEKGCRVKDRLMIKENSQVMLLWNLDIAGKLANGSRGIVNGFVPLALYRRLLEEQTRKQQQVETDEKKQQSLEKDDKQEDSESVELGQEKEMVGEEMNDSTEDGNHRCIDREITCSDSSHLEASDSELEDEDYDSIDPEILEELKSHVQWLSSNDNLEDERRYAENASRFDMTAFPYVQFTNGKKRVILPVPFKKEFKGCGYAYRWQIPLCLAWAISIHKSQGMTISWLHVNLNGCFEKGQAYVACSRGENFESMMVTNFDIDEIKTSEDVKRFYKSLDDTGCESYTKTWSDTITAFDDNWKHNRRIQRLYQGKSCDFCGARCSVRQVKHTRNKGKWFAVCPNKEYKNWDNHFYEWLPVSS